MMNRRKALRFQLQLPTQLSFLDQPETEVISATTRDISHNGVFIKTPESFYLGQELSVELRLRISLARDSMFVGQGRVVRTETEGIAITFLNSLSTVTA